MVFSWHSLPYVTPSDPQTWDTGKGCLGKASLPHHSLPMSLLTLLELASGHVRAGQTQWAKPASSTQDAPNSQCISTQDTGIMGSGVSIKIPANSGTPTLSIGSASALWPHLLHSHYGPGLDHLDTAHTWDQPHQAYRNTVQSSAHSHLSQHPEGHSCRLRE